MLTADKKPIDKKPMTADKKPKIGQPIFRDCHSFFVCPSAHYDSFIYACPHGTFCDPTNGLCKLPQDVPYCSQM